MRDSDFIFFKYFLKCEANILFGGSFVLLKMLFYGKCVHFLGLQITASSSGGGGLDE